MKSRLTDKEKLVLWGLAEYPDLKDNELSKKLGIKRRTFGAVKTKLKNNGLFSDLIVPDSSALGCEILTVVYGTLNPLIKFENRLDGAQMITKCEEVVYANSTDREFFIIAISKNFTEFRKKADELLRFYAQNKFLDDLTIVHFPFGITGYIPGAKISDISRITGITAHTVSGVKKKLLEKKIMETHKIPNFNILNCELFALTHVKHKHGRGGDYVSQPMEVLRFDSGADMVSVSLFKNYTAYKDYYDRKLEYLRDNDLIDGEPKVLLFPIQKLRYVKDFSFAPLMKKVLKVDIEF
ncbi:MAG: hypothetical protein A7316_08710 [Candidatus Altiarchaeales archaeon WOR_SM1_86-2]|nr:MAG: hypothetical protein A7316_08710 [Candidatus Altiarchaeales archaeon WOR_SM1_86-2]